MLTVSDKVGELRAMVRYSLMSDEEKRASERHLDSILRINGDAVARRRAEACGIRDRLELASPAILATRGVLASVATALSFIGLGIAVASILIGFWIIDGAYGTNVAPFVGWVLSDRVEDWYYMVLVACGSFCIPFLIVLSLARLGKVSDAMVAFVRHLVLGRRGLLPDA